MLSRRQFLGLTTGVIGAAAAGDGLLVEPGAVQVTRHDIAIPGLAPTLEGFRIACVTDVHISDGVGRGGRAVLELLGRERPHLVALVGDICNHRDDLDDLVGFARDAAGSVATVATLGNWEHDAGIDRVTAERAYDRAGVELLYNTATRVRPAGGGGGATADARNGGTGGDTLTVVGIDDPVLGHPDVPRAVRDVRDGDKSIWVLHAPGFVDSVAPGSAPTPAAILSGHTHGGQVRLPFYTPYTPSGSGRFVAGWYRDTLAPLYVSRGIGTVAIPARLFCPPELPIFTLRIG